jgi:hypothetical protein
MYVHTPGLVAASWTAVLDVLATASLLCKCQPTMIIRKISLYVHDALALMPYMIICAGAVKHVQDIPCFICFQS